MYTGYPLDGYGSGYDDLPPGIIPVVDSGVVTSVGVGQGKRKTDESQRAFRDTRKKPCDNPNDPACGPEPKGCRGGRQGRTARSFGEYPREGGDC